MANVWPGGDGHPAAVLTSSPFAEVYPWMFILQHLFEGCLHAGQAFSQQGARTAKIQAEESRP